MGLEPTALDLGSRCSEGECYWALARALSKKASKSSGRMRHSRPNFSAGSLPRRSQP